MAKKKKWRRLYPTGYRSDPYSKHRWDEEVSEPYDFSPYYDDGFDRVTGLPYAEAEEYYNTPKHIRESEDIDEMSDWYQKQEWEEREGIEHGPPRKYPAGELPHQGGNKTTVGGEPWWPEKGANERLFRENKKQQELYEYRQKHWDGFKSQKEFDDAGGWQYKDTRDWLNENNITGQPRPNQAQASVPPLPRGGNMPYQSMRQQGPQQGPQQRPQPQQLPPGVTLPQQVQQAGFGRDVHQEIQRQRQADWAMQNPPRQPPHSVQKSIQLPPQPPPQEPRSFYHRPQAPASPIPPRQQSHPPASRMELKKLVVAKNKARKEFQKLLKEQKKEERDFRDQFNLSLNDLEGGWPENRHPLQQTDPRRLNRIPSGLGLEDPPPPPMPRLVPPSMQTPMDPPPPPMPMQQDPTRLVPPQFRPPSFGPESGHQPQAPSAEQQRMQGSPWGMVRGGRVNPWEGRRPAPQPYPFSRR